MKGLTLTSVLQAILAAGLGGLGAPVWAQGSDALRAEMPSEVTLLHGWREEGAHLAGLQIDLAPGWKTYWRVPGAGGIPPQIRFEGSTNLAQAQVGFPTPHVFVDYGMRSLGYLSQVVFPVRVTPIDPSAPVQLSFQMEYGVCADICIPAQASGQMTLDPAGKADADPIQQALGALPQSHVVHGLSAATCAIRASDSGMLIEAQMGWPDSTEGLPHGVIEAGSDLIWVADPDVARVGEKGVRLTAQMEYFGEGTATLARERMRFTLISAGRAIDFQGCD